MLLSNLRTWIKQTRECEGVSWYLRDVSKGREANEELALIVYNDAGRECLTVGAIVPTADIIGFDQLHAIAEARAAAGINSGFVYETERLGTGDPKKIFGECRSRWLGAGKQEWMSEQEASTTQQTQQSDPRKPKVI